MTVLISTMIEKLEEIKAEFGDLPCVMLTDTPDGLFHNEWEPLIEQIGLPNKEENDEMQVCAIAWPHIFDTEEEPIKQTPPLSVVNGGKDKDN